LLLLELNKLEEEHQAKEFLDKFRRGIKYDKCIFMVSMKGLNKVPFYILFYFRVQLNLSYYINSLNASWFFKNRISLPKFIKTSNDNISIGLIWTLNYIV